jgi:hypothetical protein
MKLARGFSRQHRIIHFTTIGSASGLRHMAHGFTCTPPYTLTPGQPPPGLDYLPASPHHLPTTPSDQRLHHSPSLRRDQRRLHGLSIRGFSTERSTAGTGISTGYPSTTPVGLALGPDLPWADQLDPGTLGQSAQEFPTPESLLMPAFSLVNHPPLPHSAASPGTRRSPTHHSRR